jgi:NAD(P)-dependent dehydrogenase (short-subunit alcohol dehydrogenase family)
VLLQDTVAVIYGAGGAVGGAVARAMAQQGARVFLTGRRRETVELAAQAIREAGGIALAAQVDALDEGSVERHLEDVVQRAGVIDVSFNAIGLPQQGIQGIPLTELPIDSFMLPIATYMRAQFLTAVAAARNMKDGRKGVILMHTPEPARLGAPLVGGMGPMWAAMEGFNRSLSAEVAAHGVRAVALRTTGIPETATIDVVFELHARAIGMTRLQFQSLMESMNHRRKSTSLAELANAAVFLASDLASAMTGTVANLTGGAVVD